jgi:HK97 gp10 family phage protein
MMEITFKVKGAERLSAALRDPALVEGPIRDFLEASGSVVERSAKTKAPVDTGRLKNSIISTVQGLRAVVVAGVKYAPFVEFGTRPHWPPLSAMQPWARRHGFPAGRAGAFLVARAIAQRGTKAQPFMEPALRENESRINRFLDIAARNIERRWSRNG